jgi:hypothetical protein
MNTRLCDLFRELTTLLEESDTVQRLGHPTILRGQFEVLSQIDELTDRGRQRSYLEHCREAVDVNWVLGFMPGGVARALGGAHPVTITLRKMVTVAEAIVEDRPEPTDDDLARLGRPSPAASKGGCFIATAACGTDRAPSVVLLREFRETILRPTWPGRAFIAAYERLSPPAAEVVASSAVARLAARTLVVAPAAWIAGLVLSGRPGQTEIPRRDAVAGGAVTRARRASCYHAVNTRR